MRLKIKIDIGQMLLWIILIIFIIGIVRYYCEEKKEEAKQEILVEIASVEEDEEEQEEVIDLNDPINRRIDFDALSAINPDVIAWIYVPDTVIDYPIMQSGDDKPEDYYLKRDIYGEFSNPGCIFMQRCNRKDFNDSLTIIYGHKMNSGNMFASLHDYKDEEYRNLHRYVYIYTPSESKKYEVFSGATRGTGNLLSEYGDISKDVEWQRFKSYLEEKTEFLDSSINHKEKILALSTCSNRGKKRYVVFLREAT